MLVANLELEVETIETLSFCARTAMAYVIRSLEIGKRCWVGNITKGVIDVTAIVAGRPRPLPVDMKKKNIPTLHVWLAHIARYCVLTSAACAYIGKPNCPELCTAEIA